MRWIATLAVLVSLTTAFVGCGKSDTPPADQQAAAPKAPPAPPEVVVRNFLEAVRTGDHTRAESMLTELARQKTKEMDLMVAPPGSSTAKFEVGEVEVIENQVAHVESFWTDIGEDGKPQTNMFVWALRLDDGGWHIGGVATKLFDDAPVLLLNFEDPEDMMRKTQLAEQEMQRRTTGGAVPGAQATATGNFAAGAGVNPAAQNILPSGQNQPALLPPGTANPVAPVQLPPGTPGGAQPASFQAQQPGATTRQ